MERHPPQYPRATDGRSHVGAYPDGTRKSGHSRPAESFEALHPLDIFEIVHLLNCRKTGKVDARHQAARGLADRREDALLIGGFHALSKQQTKTVLNKQE